MSKKCKTCAELNEESFAVYITQVKIEGWYYHWGCQIQYCPVCGKRIEGKKTQLESEVEE